MTIDPQPGDIWTLNGHPAIEVVAVKAGDVYYVYGGKPLCDPLDKFVTLARRSIDRGAVLRRGKEVTCAALEGFEI